MHFLATKKVVDDLAHGRVSPRDKAYYLLVSYVIPLVVGWSTLTFANQGRTLAGLFEFFMMTVITVVGIQTSYEASGGDSNPNFIAEFTCLSVPVGIKTTVLVWGIYWVLGLSLRALVPHLNDLDAETARRIASIGNAAAWLAGMFVNVVLTAVFFLRMRVHMRSISKLRTSAA
jgi:hypothetical protein